MPRCEVEDILWSGGCDGQENALNGSARGSRRTVGGGSPRRWRSEDRTQPTVAQTEDPQETHRLVRLLRWAVTGNMTAAGRRDGDLKRPHRGSVVRYRTILPGSRRRPRRGKRLPVVRASGGAN